MKKLFAFAGRMGARKDTYADALKNMLIHKNDIFRYSFATPLKDELKTIIDLVLNNANDELIKEKMNISGKELNHIKSIIEKDKNISINKKTKEVRELLQFLGSNVRREKDPDYWVNKSRKEIKEKLNEQKIVIISDVRFPNEANLIKELNGVLIYLDATEESRKERIKLRDGNYPTKEALNHISESSLNDFRDYDCWVDTEVYIEKEIQNVLANILKKSY